ncbi:MAG: F0F1 ATP synthase subunit B [Candidatus Omnitrophica bacterium]|nr:F0F1 ATP synthase subunit B [Candidatus Omnitrophota bacterium]
MNNPLVREIIVQLAGFGIFFWVLKAFAWKPILKLLEDRRARIEKGFQDIESGKKEAEGLKADYHAKIAKIEEEARFKIQEAVQEGKKIAQEIREKAREEANDILVKAKQNIELEAAKAQVDLKRKIVDLALSAAGHVLKRDLNEKRQREIVEEYISELSEGASK